MIYSLKTIIVELFKIEKISERIAQEHAKGNVFKKHKILIEERKKRRSEDGVKLFKKLDEICEKESLNYPPSHQISKVLSYYRNNRDQLIRYLEIPEIEATNNISERSLREIKVKQAVIKSNKNMNGRIANDVVMTIYENCIIEDVDVQSYLSDVRSNAEDVALPPKMWTPNAWGFRQRKLLGWI